jgi:uronate dehydrogenase
MRVLITGAAGLIGGHLVKALEGEHTLRLGDIRPIPDEPRWVAMDVTQPQQVCEAMTNIDAVIHLAIASGHEGDYEDESFNQLRFDVHVKGTFNILDAARKAGIRRVIYTSSLTVVWGYAPPISVAADAPARPVGTYALTKYLGEVVCQDYARQHNFSVICLRIPKPIDPQDATWNGRRIRPQWIAFPDLLQAYRLALTTPNLGFEILTIVGESSKRRWDISKAERVLGYQPKYRLEKLGYQLGNEMEPLES